MDLFIAAAAVDTDPEPDNTRFSPLTRFPILKSEFETLVVPSNARTPFKFIILSVIFTVAPLKV